LQTKVTTLETTNTGLQNALNAEIAARTAAETALKNALDQETANREEGDRISLVGLSLEAHNRNSQFNQIAGRGKAFFSVVNDTFLVNGEGRVGQIQLPAGSYFVMAKANLENSVHDSFWTCVLKTDDLNKGFFFDSAQVDTESVGLSPNVNHQQAVMSGVVSLNQAATLILDCHTGESASNVTSVKISAISVDPN